MSIEITPGSRLRDLIERRGYKMKVFAELTGVVPTTLSKFVNGKPMSDKYIKKAAEILNVTPEYIKCESNDMTPPRYLQYTEDMTQEAKDSSRQAYRFGQMREFLKSMGVDFVWKAKIGETGDPTLLLGNYGWYPIDGKADTWMEEEEIDEIQFIKLLYNNPGSKVWIEMSFRGRKVSMEYTEFQRWMRCLVASMEIKIQEQFDVFYDVSMQVADTDIDRALRGEERIKDTENDDYDLYDQHPEKKNKKKPKPTEEEKLLDDIFGTKPQ